MEASKAVPTLFAMGSRPLSVNRSQTAGNPPSSPESSSNSWNHTSKADIKQYQAMVVSLMYAMLCTRLDSAYAIQQFSQFNSNPTNVHFQAAKRVFRYLQVTQTIALVYGKQNDNITE
jgi:hypothetical protein